MKKYSVLLIILLVFGLPSHCFAQTKINLREIYQSTQCVSVSDTNHKAKPTNVKKNYKQLYKRGKMTVRDIQVSYKQKRNGKVTTKVQFQKTYKANGYQIGYGSQFDGTSITDRKITSVKKCSKTFQKQISYIQVRPYRVINGKRCYGAWSSVYTVACCTKTPAVR